MVAARQACGQRGGQPSLLDKLKQDDFIPDLIVVDTLARPTETAVSNRSGLLPYEFAAVVERSRGYERRPLKEPTGFWPSGLPGGVGKDPL